MKGFSCDGKIVNFIRCYKCWEWFDEREKKKAFSILHEDNVVADVYICPDCYKKIKYQSEHK